MQLNFFERKKFQALSDFQHLSQEGATLEEVKKFLSDPDFFKCPKVNTVFKLQHSKFLDLILDFRVSFVEEMLLYQAAGFDPDGNHETWGPKIHGGVQTWVGLDNETLQTPYCDILKILQLLKLRPYQEVIDLGAAYGRMGIVMGGIYPKNPFIGFEYVKERVNEGNRLYQKFGMKNAKLIAADLGSSEFSLPLADVYFIYDFGQVEHIKKTLREIETLSQRRPIRVVVRGKWSREIIENEFSSYVLLHEGRLEKPFQIFGVRRF
ncbi:MAG TPA: hypothetical protein VKZ84_06945 [Bacteriovoracaceae bacterium]|nr:hypothetical protein [Bacteriovoracaceae bacterium]